MAWGVQDFDASFAATEMTTSATLRTVDERDDARVLRAYAQVRASERVRVTFETETNPQQRTRDARLTIVADTEKDARASLTVALVLLAVAIYATLS